MSTIKCIHCHGMGRNTTCDSCKKDCGPNGPYICALCEAELCKECFKQNVAHQVVCKKHPDDEVYTSGGYVNSPQWNGL
jgi:hypothetical protein